MPERLAIGMMSGTSCDGIDAALIAVRGCGLDMKARLIAHVHRAFASALRRRLLAVMAPARTAVDELLSLSVELANAHIPVAKAVIAHAGGSCTTSPDRQGGVRDSPAKLVCTPPSRSGPVKMQIAAVGVHGQTICHRPPQKPGQIGSSWQLGQFAPLAAALDIPVICDFRAADLAVGGQGAPLVPWTDWVLARHPAQPRVLINLGGVCNATFLPAGCGPDDVRAGDIGPCNILLDGLIARRTRGEENYDRNGRQAAKGVVRPELADQILRQIHAASHVAQPPPAGSNKKTAAGGCSTPKSLGREQFNAAFLNRVLSSARNTETPDLLAAAADAVARRLSWPIKAWAALQGGGRSAEVILSGGGCRNRALVEAIRRHLPDLAVETMERALGIPAEAKEAVSFALLALANLDNIPANLPAVTGARRPVVLGVRLPGGTGLLPGTR